MARPIRNCTAPISTTCSRPRRANSKPDVVRLNHRVTGFSRRRRRRRRCTFADGTSARGDLLIGADGLKSVVRRQIVGEVPATYTGDAAWRITVPVERLPENFLEPVMSVFMGPGGHVVCYYLRGGALLNFVGIVETDEVSEESWTVKLPWERLKADYRGWHPMIQTIIDAADKDQCYRWSLHNRPPIRELEHRARDAAGRLRASDAALSRAGRGDGDRGRRRAGARARTWKATIPAALQLYQRNRIDRTARIVTQSSENRRLFHPALGSGDRAPTSPSATKAPTATSGSIRTIR